MSALSSPGIPALAGDRRWNSGLFTTLRSGDVEDTAQSYINSKAVNPKGVAHEEKDMLAGRNTTSAS